MFEDFDYFKLIATILMGIALTWTGISILGFTLIDTLYMVAGVTIAWSFAFLHNEAARTIGRTGSVLNQYQRFNTEVKYNMEKKDIAPEVMLVGLVELAAATVLLIMR